MKLVFHGEPGAGKGTQAELLAAKLGIPHISTGRMVREAAKKNTPLGRQLRSLIRSGRLVSDNLMIKMLLQRLSKRDTGKGYILDGFPRTIAQARSLDRALAGGENLSAVIHLHLRERDAVERLSGRRTCPKCGRNFHFKFYPPRKPGTCYSCGSTLIQREDDSEETIRVRMRVYRKQSWGLVSLYKKRKLLYTIDAGKRKHAVAAEIGRIVEKLITKQKKQGFPDGSG